MKLITAAGLIAKARRFLSASGSVENSEEATNPDMLAKTLRLMTKRISDLESRVGPEAIDFEVNVGAGGALTSILHGFSSPVRWWVVTWTQVASSSYPTAQPVLVQDASSTSDTLVLRSYKSGRAIVRVEPALAGIDPGITVGSATSSYGHETPSVSGLRLTLTTATPVTSGDVTAATTIYLTPYLSGQIRIYTGTEWVTRDTTEVSLAVGTLAAGGIYDVFAYWTGSAVALERSAAWATAAARTDALARVNGILTKSSDRTRLYVGTFRTQTTTTTEDSRNRRFVWNMYNRVRRELWVQDTTGSWTYINPNGVWRNVRANAANLIEFVCGEATEITVRASIGCSTTAASGFATGIGINSTTVNSAQMVGNWVNASGHVAKAQADYVGTLALGYYTIWWLESGQSNALTYTFQGSGNVWKSGMSGEFLG
jgi:hypothetical protein